MPGASDGAHCERERLPLTNAVSGLPLRTCEITEACQPNKAVVHGFQLRGTPLELRPRCDQLFSQHLKTDDDRLEVRITFDLGEVGMKVALGEARDDRDDRAEAVVDVVHTT